MVGGLLSAKKYTGFVAKNVADHPCSSKLAGMLNGHSVFTLQKLHAIHREADAEWSKGLH